MVFADIGVKSNGAINWDAPVIKARGIQSIPYYVVLDASGQMLAEGKDAYTMITPWMGP